MEVNPKPTPEGGVPGDYPNKTKPSRPFIGDIPGEGSEGPTDIPNKEIHPNRPHIGDIPGEGSEGPAAIREVRRRRWLENPPLEDPPVVRVLKMLEEKSEIGVTGGGPLENPPLEDPPYIKRLYRGQQFGRKGHFGSGHQK
tara:strand:- start:3359 stop:3781 length:423 start_codon:yes stop_codon:yes gene_type:complete